MKSVLDNILDDGEYSYRVPPSNGMETCTIIDRQALVQATRQPKEANTLADLAGV